MIWVWMYLQVLSGGVLGGYLKSQARRLRIWRDAAASCGLSVVGSTSAWAWHSKLEAKADRIEVRFEGPELRDASSRISVVFPGPPGFGDVRIRREVGRSGAREIKIGDEAFDEAFSVEGPLRLVCVLLDAEARRMLLHANAKSQVEIAGGELRAEMADHEVPFILPVLLDLSRRFARKMDIVKCLAWNVQHDPEAGVRLSNLLALVHECAWGPKTEETLRAACSDRSPQVRLHAAKELGEEGRPILLALAESTEDDDCSAEALRIIGPELPFERTQAILDRAVTKDLSQTAYACLEVLGRSGTAAAVDALVQIMMRDPGELACAAALALGATGNAAAEPPLISALKREGSDLRVAAAKALGSVGSAAAVLPLKETAKRLHWDSALVRAVRQAIAEIQLRLPGATPGQLSLAGAETGQLSLAQAEGGELSFATNPAGQLSLPPEEAGQLSLSEEKEGLEPAPGDAA